MIDYFHPHRVRRAQAVQPVQAGPGGPRHTLGLPDHSGGAWAKPYPVQAAPGPRGGRPCPPVAMTGPGHEPDKELYEMLRKYQVPRP